MRDNLCRICKKPAVDLGLMVCSRPRCRESLIIRAGMELDSNPTKENAVKVAKSAGLPEDYFLKDMKDLIIPDGYVEKEEIVNTSFSRVEQYTYNGRDLEAYYQMPGNVLIGLKHICIVRIFQSIRVHCYGFYENIFGETCIELYTSFDSKLLSKVLQAHYKDVSLDDIVIFPGSIDVFTAFSFREPCIIVEVYDEKKRRLGTPIPFEPDAKFPVDYYHYY